MAKIGRWITKNIISMNDNVDNANRQRVPALNTRPWNSCCQSATVRRTLA